MSIGANTAASALAATWVHFIAAIPDGWARRENGVVAGITGVAIPTLNGVWPEKIGLDRVLVSEFLDQVANSGVPYCLQLRPGAPEQLSTLAADRGMIKEEQIPLMVLEDSGRLQAAQKVAGLVIRQLSPQEAVLHATVAARGFEVPEAPFIQLMTPSVLGQPGVRCYVGEVDGEVVTTGVGVTLGPFVGIFNIATPPEHRGQGFGAAVTARAVADGFADGAQWSYLQSSLSGYNIYARLGFATVERWECWVTET
jgi:ribosomal protein S18 acetylase RimI-like enzyme